MLKQYKEIIFGILLGVAMWVVDAAMHARLGHQVHSSGDFLEDLLHPGGTQLFFRIIFLVIAATFGWALWRSNWRERELRALEEAIITFNRQLSSPAMRIVSHSRMLCSCSCVTQDEMATSLTTSISEDAQIIDQLAQQYTRFNEQVMAGKTLEAIETLRAIEDLVKSKAVRTSRELF